MKKFFIILLIILIIPTSATAGALVASYSSTSIYIDGQKLQTTVYGINNQNNVSVKAIAESMGGTVEYDKAQNRVDISTSKPGTVQDVAKQADNCVYIAMMKDTTQKGTASGVLWGTDYILTNKHVTENYGVNKWIATGNKDDLTDKYYCTEAKTFDTILDIALIKTDRPHVNNLKIGDSSKVKVGDSIVVISSPRAVKNVVTDGEITKIQYFEGRSYFISNALTSPGSSGGGMFTMQGELIGIIYGGYETEKMACAMSINDIQSIIK